MEKERRKKRRRTLLVLLLLGLLLLGGGFIIFLNQSFDIRFETYDGEILKNMKATRKAADLPVPIQPGQTFLGWTVSNSPTDTDYVTSTGQLSSATTLYAHWRETQFVINFYSEGEPVILSDGQHSQLSYDENTVFNDTTMRAQSFWTLDAPAGSAHASFSGWEFKDTAGDTVQLVHPSVPGENSGMWRLKNPNNSLQVLDANNPFRPQLYDGVMHAVWTYKDFNVAAASVSSELVTGTFHSRGSGSYNNDAIDLPDTWYSGTETLVGWKIAFDPSWNNLHLSIDGNGILRDTSNSLGAIELQKINEMYNRIYPVFRSFHTDPLLAYLTHQIGGGTHTLRFYPVTVAADATEERFFDENFNRITESGQSIKIIEDEIEFSMPRNRINQTFSGYSCNGVKYMTRAQLDAAPYNRIRKPISDFAGIPVTNAIIFTEDWDSSITLNFNYGPAAVENKNGFHDNGVRRLHSIDYNADTSIKARYKNGEPMTEKAEVKVGQTISLPSASMYVRANMYFIGWREQTPDGEKPGRIYPAGYEYTVSAGFGTSYTLYAVWSDSLVNFSFNLAGGREFAPNDLHGMRGGESDADGKVNLPTTLPTRFGYEFTGWKSNIPDSENGDKTQYQPGEKIPVMTEKQILTALWVEKHVDVTLNLEFVYSDASDNDFTIRGDIIIENCTFDQTIRLQSINPATDLVNITKNGAAAPGDKTNILAAEENGGWFSKFYRLVGWTFRDRNNPNDSFAVTVWAAFDAQPIISLNDRIVHENTDGTLRADGFSVSESKTVDIAICDDGGNVVKTLRRLIKSEFDLSRSASTNAPYLSDVLNILNPCYEFIGFIAVPTRIAESASDMSEFLELDINDGSKRPFIEGKRLQFNGSGIPYVEGSSPAKLLKLVEPMYMYLWLKPRPIAINYYGVVDLGGKNWTHTATPSYPAVASYFDDERSWVQNLGENLDKIPIEANFDFMRWHVEYFTADNPTVPFHTQQYDLKLNELGQPTASTMSLGLQTDLKYGITPVSVINVYPVMQSILDFSIQINVGGLEFNVVLDKDSITDSPPYKLGTVELDETKFMETTTVYTNGGWGAARWPQVVFGGDPYYWNGDVYVGPASAANPYITLEDWLDDISKTIMNFSDEGGTFTYNFHKPSEAINGIYGLHIGATDATHFDVRSGYVVLVPQLDELEYVIEIWNGGVKANTITTTGGGAAITKDETITFNSTQFNSASQPGYYYSGGGLSFVLSTTDYLEKTNTEAPRDQRANGSPTAGEKKFRFGLGYNVGTEIPTRTFGALDGMNRKVIKLYIIWLQCDVVVRYENTGNSSAVITQPGNFMVGDEITALLGAPAWYNYGYTFEGWIESGSAAEHFAFGQPNVMLAAGATNAAVGVLDVRQGSYNFGSHTYTLTLNPYWKSTEALSVTFDFTPYNVNGDSGSGVAAGAYIDVEDGNKWHSYFNSGDPQVENYKYKVPSMFFEYNALIGGIEANWKMFNYCTNIASIVTNDVKVFDGWFFKDALGIEHPLTVTSGGSLRLGEDFLYHVSGNEYRITQNIVIYAKWSDVVEDLIKFNIADEAVLREYLVKNTPSGGTTVNNISVRNGVSGDAIIDVADTDSATYELKYNEYIGPEFEPSSAVFIAIPGTETEVVGAIGRYVISKYPQFYRTEVVVEAMIDGQTRRIIKTLNPTYEKVGGAPDGRNEIVAEAALTRWETQRISGSSASQMDSTHPFAAEMVTRFGEYNTVNLTDYAMFEGRAGGLHTNYLSAGVTINNIYETFVKGAANDVVLSAGADNQFTRDGYELVGFSISDEFNTGVAFGWDGSAPVFGDSYVNNYLFSPVPHSITFVPIYQALDATITLNPNFAGDPNHAAFTDVIYDGNIIANGGPAYVDAQGNSVSYNGTTVTIATKFDRVINLPYLETRGVGKSPLNDIAQWHDAWRYGTAPEKYLTFGEQPPQTSGWTMGGNTVVENGAFDFHVKSDALTSGGGLSLTANWGSSSRVHIHFNVLVPETGKSFNEWTVVEPLYFDKTFTGLPSNDNVAYHFLRPILKNGIYSFDAGKAPAQYTIPMPGYGLDSAFSPSFSTTGLVVNGWYMELHDTGKPDLSAGGKYTGNVVDKCYNTGTFQTVNMEYPASLPVDTVVNVYLVYEWVTGYVAFDINSTGAYVTPSATIGATYGYNVALPSIASGTVITTTETRDLQGWTKDIKLGTMKSYVAAAINAAALDITGWEEGDFVKIDNSGAPEFYRKVTDTGGISPADIITATGGTLVRTQVYNSPANPYVFDCTVQGASVFMWGVWGESIVTHTFVDGAITIWNPSMGSSHNPAYGLEDGAFPNGILFETKYFNNSVYGNDLSASLPTPIKPGFAFLCWEYRVGPNATQFKNGVTKLQSSSSSITLYAVWAELLIQSVGKSGSLTDQLLADQEILVFDSGSYRPATRLELAGKKLDIDNITYLDDFGTYNFALVGANIPTLSSGGDTYAFVGWLPSAASTNANWRWNDSANISGRLIPDGVSAGTVNIKITNSTIKYYHALYDISSGSNVTYTAVVGQPTNVSVKAADPNASGNIAIPAAVIDSTIGGTTGFMKCVTEIESEGFARMTGTCAKVYIGGEVTTIGDYAFLGNDSILEIAFGHVSTANLGIGEMAFADNRALTTVEFAGGVAPETLSIGDKAFWSDTALTTIFTLPAAVIIGERAFEMTAIAAFTSANVSPDATHRYYVADGDLRYWESSMSNYFVLLAPGKQMPAIDMNESKYSGVTRIMAGAFAYHLTLLSIVIPDTVKTIDEGAFESTYGVLETITLGHSTPTGANGIHGGAGTATWNPFAGTTAEVWVNASYAQLATWRGEVAYQSPMITIFKSTQNENW